MSLSPQPTTYPNTSYVFNTCLSANDLKGLTTMRTHAGEGRHQGNDATLAGKLFYHLDKHGFGRTPEEYIRQLAFIMDQAMADPAIAKTCREGVEIKNKKFPSHSCYLDMKHDASTQGIVVTVRHTDGSFVRFTYPQCLIITGESAQRRI